MIRPCDWCRYARINVHPYNSPAYKPTPCTHEPRDEHHPLVLAAMHFATWATVAVGMFSLYSWTALGQHPLITFLSSF